MFYLIMRTDKKRISFDILIMSPWKTETYRVWQISHSLTKLKRSETYISELEWISVIIGRLFEYTHIRRRICNG